MRLKLTIVGLLVLATADVRLQQQPNPADRFEVSDVMIPMRDGKRLHTKIFTPRVQTAPLPIIFKRTPYGIRARPVTPTHIRRSPRTATSSSTGHPREVRVRGDFVMQRLSWAATTRTGSTRAPTPTTPSVVDRERPQQQRPRRMLGVSTTAGRRSGAIEPHPALKAISPQASPADMWFGDDFHTTARSD